MGLSQQEYWSGLPCFPPGDLPNPGVEPVSPASPALAGGFFTTKPSGNPKQHLSKSVKTTHSVGEDIYLEKKLHTRTYKELLPINKKNIDI